MSPTTRPRPSTCLRGSSAARALVLAAVVAALVLPARAARAQACCAAAGLVAPTRLRSYEDFAAGMQARARTVTGSFDDRGGYTASGAGESELDFEQDLFVVARVLSRGQLALVIPFVQTHRAIASDARWGGGVGDIALNARYDFIASGERSIPGLAVLAGLVLPTGTPPEDAGDPLSAGATGQGSVEGSLGVGIEQAIEPYFLSGVALVGLRAPRSVAGTRESFAPRLTGSLAAGRVLPHGATLGIFTSALWQGDNSDDRGPIAGSSVALWTAGLAGTAALSDDWRLQSTAFADLPIQGLGRNQTVGFGGSLSLMKLWL